MSGSPSREQFRCKNSRSWPDTWKTFKARQCRTTPRTCRLVPALKQVIVGEERTKMSDLACWRLPPHDVILSYTTRFLLTVVVHEALPNVNNLEDIGKFEK